MKIPELLAPVNGPDGLNAALAAGADAVYLGLKEFNARKKARNFSIDELEQAVRDCHRARCRVHLTFNTLLFDSELPRAAGALGAAWEAGVDALIVQDLAVVRMVREWLPDLPLHASTQMTVHHPSQLAPLSEAGIDRVILARELELGEVGIMARAAEDLGMGVEVFAHGALCVSYSGQCLISAFMEGRSGNRGLCAQLCRRPFKVESGGRRGSRSLKLSMKDLSALPLLPGLVRAGVRSLKVEGRLKRPEYVAGVVAVYKEALFRITAGERGPFPDLEERLRLVFNRGFSLGGLKEGFTADQTTGKWGGAQFLKVGSLLRHDEERQRLFVQLEHVPEPGDGVVLFPEGGKDPFAFIVTKVFPPEEGGAWIGIKPLEGKCPTWGTLYLSSSAKELDRIRSSIDSYELPRIGIHIGLSGSEGEPLTARVTTEFGQEVADSSSKALEHAGNQPLTITVLEEHLGRLGNTPYLLKSLTWEGETNLFLPKSELNALRRTITKKLGRGKNFRRSDFYRFPPVPDQVPDTTKISVLCSARDIAAALDAGAARVYCPVHDLMGSEGLADPPIWLWIPPVTSFSLFERIEHWLERNRDRVEGVLAGHLGAACLAKRLGMPFWADTSFNIMNALASEEVARMGAAGASLSWEADSARLGSTSLPHEVVALGRPPLMQTGLKKLVKGKGPHFLIDDDQRRYPVKPWFHNQGFTVEHPSFRLAMDGLGEVSYMRLDLREIPAESHAAMIKGFQHIMDDPSRKQEILAQLDRYLPRNG